MRLNRRSCSSQKRLSPTVCGLNTMLLGSMRQIAASGTCAMYSLPEFLTRMHAHVPAQSPKLVKFNHMVDGTNIEFIADSSIAPSFYSSWDDSTFVLNSFDSAVDTTLQSSKTLAYGEKVPPWSTSNTFVPP